MVNASAALRTLGGIAMKIANDVRCTRAARARASARSRSPTTSRARRSCRARSIRRKARR
jgi:hypothetical protein